MLEISSEIVKTRKFLKDRLLKDVTTFRGHESEWSNIRDLLERTAENGESNSALLKGPRGCGKTTLIASVLADLLPQECFYKNTLIVYLNGLIHTDDRQALISATSQLNLENAVDGKVFGSFSENLAFLLACLKSGDKKKSKSVVFILEEFDLFCAHHNQTLLYNLFDVAQSAQAPICVIGITCRLDVVELLEKRVKSRFSHRQIFLMPKPNDFEGRLQLFTELLKLPTEKELKVYQKNKQTIPKEAVTNKELVLLKRVFDPTKYSFSSKWISSWNKEIDSLASTNKVKSLLQNMYDEDSDESNFKTFLFQIVAHLNESCKRIDFELIQKLAQNIEHDDKIALLCGLSVLEICLLIPMKHHSEIYDRDPFNFEMVLTRYSKFANASTTMQNIDRAVVLKAFEHIKNLEFIIPISNVSAKVQKEYQLHKLLLTNRQISQAITKSQNLPTEVHQWAQSSII